MSRETAPRFSGIGGHHSAKAGTVEWLTPPGLLARLGEFDLDPCAPIVQPYPTARRTFTAIDNGLIQRWEGRIWLNPPYSNDVIGKWLGRLAEHGRGTALIFARTETEAFCRNVWDRASALLFIEGRINFHVGTPFTDPKTGRHYALGDQAPQNAGAPTVLCAYGKSDADVLAGCEIKGRFVPLRLSAEFFVFVSRPEADKPWSAAIEEFFAARKGPIDLDEIYRHFAGTPRSARNPNFDAKIRQQLQKGPYRNVARGRWEKS